MLLSLKLYNYINCNIFDIAYKHFESLFFAFNAEIRNNPGIKFNAKG